MKYIMALLLLILTILGIFFGLLFTEPGNKILRPYIEKEIQKQLPVPAKLETFRLRPDNFAVSMLIGSDSTVDVEGTFDVADQSIDADYRIDIKELSDLKKLIGTEMYGPIRAKGHLQGGQKSAALQGDARIAGGIVDYLVGLKMFQPKKVIAKAANLRIDRLLEMVGKPAYASGFLDINAKITHIEKSRLRGKILTAIRKGTVDADNVARDFNITLPPSLPYRFQSETNLQNETATSKLRLESGVANLRCDAMRYDLPQKRLDSDYRLDIPDLNRLQFVTHRPLKGKLTLTGNVETSPKGLKVTAHSELLNGAFDATVENNMVHASLKNIQTVALTDMLLYPHIFDSRANAQLDYDTLTRKGRIKALLLDGQILPNRMSFLLQQMANFDITKEIYERTTLQTQIDDKKLTSDLKMKSRFTELSAKEAVVDLDENSIDAVLLVQIKKLTIPVTFKGALDKPKISIDARDLAKARAKKELEKRLPAKLKNSPAGDVIKKLF